jgi:hypothetical protein
MGKTAIEVKKARAALATPGTDVEDIMGIMSIMAIILANIRRKICPSTSKVSKIISYPAMVGIIFIKLIVKEDIEFIIQAPNIPMMVRIATILGTKVKV